MTKEKAELVARFIEEQLIKSQEPVVFVEVMEINGYLPKIYIGQRITRCYFRPAQIGFISDGYVIICELTKGTTIGYVLDDPIIDDDTATLRFRVKNLSGRKILRSFTLMRSYRDQEEQFLWLRWKHNLL